MECEIRHWNLRWKQRGESHQMHQKVRGRERKRERDGKKGGEIWGIRARHNILRCYVTHFLTPPHFFLNFPNLIPYFFLPYHQTSFIMIARREHRLAQCSSFQKRFFFFTMQFGQLFFPTRRTWVARRLIVRHFKIFWIMHLNKIWMTFFLVSRIVVMWEPGG